MIVNQVSHMPPTVPFGSFRFWDCGANWPLLQTAQDTFGWAPLDKYLASLKEKGVSDVLYTLGRTPKWASMRPNDDTCNYSGLGPAHYGNCHLWADLNPDGTGTNDTWKRWVMAIARHVNDPGYLQTHARIKYWEPWNEFYRSTTLANYSGSMSYQGTYAQLVRITEDTRCMITGKGSVNGQPCAATPIDATAKIVAPSGAANFPGGLRISENFLYCDASPKSGTQCTTGRRGADAVDVLNYHLYVPREPLEVNLTSWLRNLKATLEPPELAKPLWSGENSWGVPGRNDFDDPDLQAGFVARFHLLAWSLGVSREFWYSWETDVGQLWSPDSGLAKAGVAYEQIYDWMVGSTMSSLCRPQGSVWTCGLTRPGGYQGLAVWDTSRTCNNGNCGTVPYQVGPQYTQYRDLAGKKVNITGRTVPIGIKPILLENH
jgi:hypothetical protein